MSGGEAVALFWAFAGVLGMTLWLVRRVNQLDERVREIEEYFESWEDEYGDEREGEGEE